MRLKVNAVAEMQKGSSMRRAVAAVLVAGSVVSPAGMPLAAIAQQGSGQVMTIHSNVNRVLTNVVVREKKSGAVIKDLKQSDFQILEVNYPGMIPTEMSEMLRGVSVPEPATTGVLIGGIGLWGLTRRRRY